MAATAEGVKLAEMAATAEDTKQIVMTEDARASWVSVVPVRAASLRGKRGREDYL